jgi:hypothetical protein
MDDATFCLSLRCVGVSTRVAFRSRREAELVRSCVEGRVSGSRLPQIAWERQDGVPAEVRLEVEDLGDDLMVRFRGAVETEPYRVDKAGFHWDFGKVVTALLLPQITGLGIVAIHAAALAWSGRCVLLPGSSGAGKSSIAYASMALGAEVRASELSFVRDSSLIFGNSRLTIDAAALSRFGIERPPESDQLDGRIVVDLPIHDQHVPVTGLCFPRVGLGSFSIRPITARRARMLLYENAVGQLPVTHLLAHETQPVGIPPSREQLATIAAEIGKLSDLDPVILEGTPHDIARHLAGAS